MDIEQIRDSQRRFKTASDEYLPSSHSTAARATATSVAAWEMYHLLDWAVAEIAKLRADLELDVEFAHAPDCTGKGISRMCAGCIEAGELRQQAEIARLRARLARIHCMATDPQYTVEQMAAIALEAAERGER